ncbi:unnamed protein product [Leuciscus chuanchicus]
MLETSDQNADADEDFPEQNLLDIQKLCSKHLLSSLALLKPLESSRSGLNVRPDWIGEGVGIEQYHTHTQTPWASISLSHFSVL